MYSQGAALVENPGTSAQSIVPYRDLHTVKHEAFNKIKQYMKENGFSLNLIDDAVTVVGELISNVGKHAYEDENHCQVIIELMITNSYIKIIVTDFGKGEIVEPATIDLMAEHGKGLYMAKKISEVVFLSKAAGFHSVQATIRK